MSIDPNMPPAYGPGQRQGGGSKIWLFLGVGCGVMLLLCCGVGTALFMTLKQSIQTTNDPAEVAQISKGIADVDLPPGFEPKGAFTMGVPFSDKKLFTVAGYGHTAGDAMISLAEFPVDFAQADQQQLKQQLDQSLQQQGQRAKSLQVDESRTIDVTINGAPAAFAIQQASDRATNAKYVQVIGVFKGKSGTAMLMAQLPADQYTEEDAEKLVRSIK
ncbi:MAG TPA: hypothetical protein VJ783_09070 [Pirellulales bacterium]|nr:hypothetical protein [Pirellulales bacterium]